MISITEYLETIYKDFKSQNDNGERLCELKKLTFESGGLPDYSNIQIQRLYLLRYAFAYAYEYTDMYAEVLAKMHNPSKVSVASIGCGAMLDYWSLVQAIEKKRKIECNIRYCGIDEINWNYKVIRREDAQIHFGIGNAIDFFEKNTQFISDVYFFPKSISEFSDEEMKIVAKNFRNKPIIKDTFFVCISIRSNELSMDRDMQKTKMIIDALQHNGYKASQAYNRYTHYKQNVGIATYDSDYIYPDNAREYIINLNKKCAHFIKNGINCEESCKCLNRWPVMKTGMICYQIIKFERMKMS